MSRRAAPVEPRASVSIESVIVKPGETLTVYMRTSEGQQQVEVRVSSKGVPEIFFVRWKPLR